MSDFIEMIMLNSLECTLAQTRMGPVGKRYHVKAP